MARAHGSPRAGGLAGRRGRPRAAARRRGHAALGRRRAATGRIVAWQPPEELAYTWDEGEGESLVRFSLTADGDGTRVVLTHERIDSLSGFAAGWHAHLDMLEGLLDGRPVDWQERWDELRPRYEEVMSG